MYAEILSREDISFKNKVKYVGKIFLIGGVMVSIAYLSGPKSPFFNKDNTQELKLLPQEMKPYDINNNNLLEYDEIQKFSGDYEFRKKESDLSSKLK